MARLRPQHEDTNHALNPEALHLLSTAITSWSATPCKLWNFTDCFLSNQNKLHETSHSVSYQAFSFKACIVLYSRVYGDIVALDLSIKLPQHHNIILGLVQGSAELSVSILQGLAKRKKVPKLNSCGLKQLLLFQLGGTKTGFKKILIEGARALSLFLLTKHNLQEHTEGCYVSSLPSMYLLVVGFDVAWPQLRWKLWAHASLGNDTLHAKATRLLLTLSFLLSFRGAVWRLILSDSLSGESQV